ncbi:MAG: arginase [Planctomycetota bacterium]
MARRRVTSILSVHIDLGAGRRGVDMGPSAIRIAGLTQRLADLGWTVLERGSLYVREPESVKAGRTDARYLKEVLDVCTRLKEATEQALARGALPLVLGGDHSLAMGSIAGVSNHFHAKGKSVGVLWMDAHTDMNTPETSPSGNIHGMPLAHMLGHGLPQFRKLAARTPAIRPERTALMGIRSVDPNEADLVRKTGVRVYTMSEIDERGFSTCLAEALDRVTDGTAGVHMSFDLDGVDPKVAPGVGTPVPGGLSYREAHWACEAVARSGSLVSMDMVELNPVLDERNETGRLAVELILSAFGKTIL